MNLESIMLSEMNRKDKYCMASLICAICESYIYRNRELIGGCQGVGHGGNGEMLVKEYTFAVIR